MSPEVPTKSLDVDMEIPSRVHIVPLGYEKSRVYEATKDLKADDVVLIIHKDDDENSNEYLRDVSAELSELGIKPEIDVCDLFDLYDSLSVIAKQISEHQKDEVFVNVSTGSKVTAIAGMIACMVFDATPYYVHGEGYEDGMPPKSTGEISKLPQYEIDAPSRAQVELMTFIRDRMEESEPVTKGDLIYEAEQRSLEFITQSDVQEKGKYRLLDRNVVEPLVESGYLEVHKSGRNKEVILTASGMDAVMAFEGLV